MAQELHRLKCGTLVFLIEKIALGLDALGVWVLSDSVCFLWTVTADPMRALNSRSRNLGPTPWQLIYRPEPKKASNYVFPPGIRIITESTYPSTLF